MSSDLLSALFAQTANNRPLDLRAIAAIVFFGCVGIVSLFGLFASNETLESMSGIIGTKKPLVARIICGIGALLSLFLIISAVAYLLGKL